MCSQMLNQPKLSARVSLDTLWSNLPLLKSPSMKTIILVTVIVVKKRNLAVIAVLAVITIATTMVMIIKTNFGTPKVIIVIILTMITMESPAAIMMTNTMTNTIHVATMTITTHVATMTIKTHVAIITAKKTTVSVELKEVNTLNHTATNQAIMCHKTVL